MKIWTEDGRPRERVIEVAGDPESGASVDPDTCAPRGDGAARLCRVWTDPDFDPQASAVYYARVLENPSCRWTGHLCARHGVRCGSGDVPDALAFCCDGETPLTVQERAWTSPVWYAPREGGPG